MNENWMPVTKDLPKSWEMVLVFDTRYRDVRPAMRVGNYWLGAHQLGTVRLWKPMPKETENEKEN